MIGFGSLACLLSGEQDSMGEAELADAVEP